LARKARTPVAAEEERARSVSEVEALATRLPVTGGLPEDAVPVDVQIAIRDEARDVLTRGAATPQEADRLWERLPSYWRRQWRPQFRGDRADVRRMRAIRSSRVVIAASARRTGESPAGEDAQAPTLTALPAAAALPPFVRGGTAPPIQASLP
jgi:hypothetical protein